MALFDVIVNTCGLVGEDGVPAKKRSSIHLEVKGDVLDNDAMGGHIKGDPVQGGARVLTLSSSRPHRQSRWC